MKMRYLVWAAVGVAAVAIAYQGYPDLKRYIKIERM
jgi:hypothetical protein